MVLKRESGLLRQTQPTRDPWSSADFFKMSGAGNDFIVLDNRERRFEGDVAENVRRVCRRGLSVGADGVLMIETSRRARLRLVVFNSDGGRATFCANGTRCAARFAFVNVIASAKMTIETDWGVIGAEVEGETVTLRLPEIEATPITRSIEVDGRKFAATSLTVGVPHLVVVGEEDLAEVDVATLGQKLRHHPDLGPEGANVHFVRVQSEHEATIRSYERGVEAETLSCGSGIVAAALVGLERGTFRPPVVLVGRSGLSLEVSANVMSLGFASIELSGDARIVYRSQLAPETLA